MSGSGPTVFGIFKERGAARECFEALKKQGLAKQILSQSLYSDKKQKGHGGLIWENSFK